ncbi:cell wall anchor protein [Chryseobacterium sp. CKR4-1]|uniref:cell wall anchor protein n=1 Tax=Chryseobacterium sp. CKR4-1 TaxID=3068896 RepID=UPI00279662F0|nr:cell wall anchor protein [Chryseobacterium sp. CKR4-1]MDQ1806476.1 cell wall anchor protein [Chryseobacterium sp. CKR4-1]
MKQKLFSLVLLASTFSFAQQAENLKIHDTRSTNALPSAYNFELKTEFKSRDAIGVPGSGLYSGLLTIAPWKDNSGNKHHQLNFNDGGIFYRNALPADSQWGNWGKLLIESNDGKVRIGMNDIDTNNNSIAGLRVYRTEGAALEVANSLGVFQIGKSSCNGCFSAHAEPGDTVLRNLGNTHNIIISMPNTRNDGSSYIGLNDGANGTWIKFFNNGIARFNGRILAKEVEVKANVWADYVFKKDYRLRSLEEVEQHIEEKGHLPNIPSAEEVIKNGINVAEMNAKLLEKIEELTLYSIEQNKQLKFQSEQLKQVQKENKVLKSQSEKIEKLEKQLEFLLSEKN